MVVVLVSSHAAVPCLETLLASAGWRTRRRDIDDETLSAGAAADREVEIEAIRAPHSRVVILVSALCLESATLLDHAIAQYSARGVQVMVVTPRASESSERQLIARAMAAGAADFVVATSVKDELLVRLEALAWRRRPAREQRTDTVYDVAIDRAHRRLSRDGIHVALTPGELRVFSCLARHAGRPIARASIRQCLTRYPRSRTTNLVDVYVLYLRRKLAELRCSCAIRTVRGVGYALVGTPALPAAHTWPAKRDDRSASSRAS